MCFCGVVSHLLWLNVLNNLIKMISRSLCIVEHQHQQQLKENFFIESIRDYQLIYLLEIFLIPFFPRQVASRVTVISFFSILWDLATLAVKIVLSIPLSLLFVHESALSWKSRDRMPFHFVVSSQGIYRKIRMQPCKCLFWCCTVSVFLLFIYWCVIKVINFN